MGSLGASQLAPRGVSLRPSSAQPAAESSAAVAPPAEHAQLVPADWIMLRLEGGPESRPSTCRERRTPDTRARLGAQAREGRGRMFGATQ